MEIQNISFIRIFSFINTHLIREKTVKKTFNWILLFVNTRRQKIQYFFVFVSLNVRFKIKNFEKKKWNRKVYFSFAHREPKKNVMLSPLMYASFTTQNENVYMKMHIYGTYKYKRINIWIRQKKKKKKEKYTNKHCYRFNTNILNIMMFYCVCTCMHLCTDTDV